VIEKESMPQGDTNRQIDWTAKHTLTEQDFRKLILEKVERAKLLQKEDEIRRLKEFA
jgi:hypothetical protein